jgi:hypothetical protein
MPMMFILELMFYYADSIVLIEADDAPKTGFGVVLIHMIADSWSLQALKLPTRLKKPRLSRLKRRQANSSRGRRELSAALENKEHHIAQELSLQLHRGRKGLRWNAICTRSKEHTNLRIMMKRHLHSSSLIS